MISTLTPSDQQFINNLGAISQRLGTDELQISSGVRMNQVSDYPDQISQLLEARASLSTSQQISANLGNVTTEVNGGEQALETAGQSMGSGADLGRRRRDRDHHRGDPPAIGPAASKH